MHTEYQRAGFFIFFHHEAHEEHIFAPLRGLIFPYNPVYPACPPISGGYILSKNGEKQHAFGENR